MKLLCKAKFRQQHGFTLVEVMVTVVLTGMIIGLAGIFFNFSFQSERKIEDEFALQASMRQASTVLNNAIREATVTFTLAEDVFTGSKKNKWNYFGVENSREIVQYTWNEGTGTHDKKVLIKAQEGISYNLYFTQNDPKLKLIQFNLECIPNGNETKKIAVETELSALNSVAVDDGGSVDNPATAIAYRSDPAPNPEVIITQEEVTIAIALVLDDSGSMDQDMEGRSPGEWHFNSSNVRKTIMKNEAKKLIDQFAALGNIQVSIIPFANNANQAGAMQDCESEKTVLKTKINGLDAYGGTNTGDGLRRAYYKLKDYNTAHSAEEIVNYVILLTDGNPTYRSSSNYWTYQAQTSDGNSANLFGSGQETTSNMNDCMNYVDTIGQNLVVGQTLDIRTFVIGFSAVSSDVSRARDIAEDSCTSSSNAKRTGTYYAAGSDIELENVFNEIKTTILQETWHIYGPY